MSSKADELLLRLSESNVKRGDIKKIAKEIKKDHELALTLWGSGVFNARHLATLLFDKKQITESFIADLIADMAVHPESERNYLSEWFLANQLMKDPKLVALIQTWQEAASPTQRRLFWYHQARLRWTGAVQPENSGELLKSLESDMESADPEVQWTMNFCAGWIGVFEPVYRERCITLGKKLGLYKVEKVPKNCTPSYLPDFISVEVAKREG